MRLKKLIIELFGHFSGAEFDFGSRSGRDFHIIYGRNEAGKSTLMAAYLRLLFGIGKNEPYAFLHGRKSLRIAALLEEENGAERFIRRAPSGHGSALYDKNGAKLPDQNLESILRGISEQQYRDLLCLDDETIERGGQEILAAKGDMGEILFSAGSGLVDFSRKLSALEQQTEDIYKPRGQKTRLAELKRRYEALERAIKDRDIPANVYQELLQQAEDSADAVLRCDDGRRAAADKYELLRALKAAEETLSARAAEMQALVDEMKRARREMGCAEAEEAEDCVKAYQNLADFRLTQEQIEDLENLRAEAGKAQQADETAAQELADLRLKTEKAAQELARRRAALPAEELRRKLAALTAACEAEDIAARLQTADAQTKTAEQRFAAALTALAINGQVFAAPPVCPASARDIDALARRAEQAERDCEALETEKAGIAAELETVKRQIAAQNSPAAAEQTGR